jgi:hypothetical protein
MLRKDVPNASNEVILREILDVLTSLRDGHFTSHLPEEFPGVGGEIAKVFNQHVSMLKEFRAEHHRLTEEIGVTGRLGGQIELDGLTGAWKEMVDETNRAGAHLTAQCRDQGNIVRSLIRGELSARATCTCIRGEFREFREELNELADQFEQRSGVAVAPV